MYRLWEKNEFGVTELVEMSSGFIVEVFKKKLIIMEAKLEFRNSI